MLEDDISVFIFSELLYEVQELYEKGDMLAYPMIILGIGKYKKFVIDDDIRYTRSIVDAIHRFYSSNEKARDGYYKALVDIINKSYDFHIADKAFNIICYQAIKEINGTALFCIPHFELVEQLKGVIRKNINTMREEVPNIETWLEEMDGCYKQINSKKRGIVSAEKVFNDMRKYFYGTSDFGESYRVSKPVLHKENDIMFMSSFILCYEKKDIDDDMYHRPKLWLKLSIINGELICVVKSKYNDFSNADYETRYKLNLVESFGPIGRSDIEELFLFDIVRDKYLLTGEVPMKEYKTYMNKIMSSVPDDYKRFYKELSIPFE